MMNLILMFKKKESKLHVEPVQRMMHAIITHIK